ncbi:P-loop containing nucleoside triphosphate hydrolase [Pyrrhoderma noxium]|uniref:P-loop containing nucleoside triphosphate hydrolase n=1 Tax=Pyrrhoderma noxium TaxID=2282107 RepID=A0A286U7D2_9AGAM|nr:P-loop containing nucleoside triphosphate hydrolase [Pyrrhoderma noxium]
MFRSILLIISAFLLAGHVTALNITGVFPNQNITSAQMLEIPTGDYTETCSSTCSPLNTTIINCAENTTCVCADTNERAPDPRVGSNLLLSQYSTACNLSKAVALTIAPTWDGPTDIILNTPSTVVVVGFGALMAGGFLCMFSSI